MASAVGQNALGIDANNFFTRGTAGQTDNVGKSMVQRHAEQMQLEKEQTALQKLGILLPQLGFFSRLLALRETKWDVDKALVILRRFVAENDLALKALQKKRKKVQRELEKQQEAPSASASSDSGAASSDSGGDGSDSDGGARKKRKHGAKDKGSKKKRGKDKEKRGKDKEKKQRAKDKDKAPAAKVLTHSENFGKHGIIRESDTYAKRDEFILWALEVKKTDVENLGKFDERDLFKDYMEDYNTGTLPHRKYYDLEAYERAKAAKAAAKGEKVGPKKKTTVNDEEARRQERAEERQKVAAERMVDAYRELKYTDKGQEMKQQEMLRAQMALAYKTGDVTLAHKMQARLKPDEPKPAYKK
ncbi:hypothetical protein TSOC_003861 [Tetrabaena socialis]|uniref:Uncharacterized protein n=1 Tax=Tetrabaena socialis TaxID=47790 RepID=A0A2J8AAK8_9CHLO|nr:hypothetical protein TSOC_003861 [Tetrabaena socialis]|eukprot:PNH09503.1 hypothetical protein TSOC_003861 [Tetrabaena socialis]